MEEINSMIIAIIGAIVGAIITVIANKIISKFDEKNKLKNTKINLKVEFEYNMKSLEDYNEKYLKQNLSTIFRLDTNKTLLDFYNNLGSFPILNHPNWDNSQENINLIFKEREIKEMIEFNSKCDKLKEKSINLHKKYDNDIFKDHILNNESNKEKKSAQSDIEEFEKMIRETIHQGDIALIYFRF